MLSVYSNKEQKDKERAGKAHLSSLLNVSEKKTSSATVHKIFMLVCLMYNIKMSLAGSLLALLFLIKLRVKQPNFPHCTLIVSIFL